MADMPDRPSDLSAKEGPSDRPVGLSALWRRGRAPDLRASLAGSGSLRPTGKKRADRRARGQPFLRNLSRHMTWPSGRAHAGSSVARPRLPPPTPALNRFAGIATGL
jgi:hypothetical protein